MNFLRGFIHRPQKVWLRRLNFQIHLWIGLILTLYLILIGLTGSILVFREDLEAMAATTPWGVIEITPSHPLADPAIVIDRVRAAFPDARLISLSAPTAANPVYFAALLGRGRGFGLTNLAIHPVTGQILGRQPRRAPPKLAWLAFVRNLHETLFLRLNGRQINGMFAAFLLLVNLTGMVVWWPGLKGWTRALTVDFARTWRRINFDLHRAVGFWTLGIVSFWALSGIYFAWPGQTLALVERFSPVVSARPPAIRVNPPESPADPADLHAILSEAARVDPGGTLRQILFPSGRRAPLEISLQRPGTRGAEFADTLYFDPWDGRCLAIWKFGVNQSLGDWFLWLQVPLHFGTFWGLGVKLLWAVLGLTIPLLSVTGALMYWNRYLRRHWPVFSKPAPMVHRAH